MSLKAPFDSYCKAFNDRKLEAALSLLSEHAVFEMPLLGQRLFGKAEIAVGLQSMFDVTETAKIEFSGIKESGRLLIGEGNMIAKLRRDAAPVSIPLALALEAKDGKISRLSTYLDARPYRLWTDGLIFAASASSSNQ